MPKSSENAEEIPKQVLDEARTAGADELLIEFVKLFPENRVSRELIKAAEMESTPISSVQRMPLARALWFGESEQLKEYASPEKLAELESVLYPQSREVRDFQKYAAEE